jgi:hypothetical protein
VVVLGAQKHGLTEPANARLYSGWREFNFDTTSLPPACHNHDVQIMSAVMELLSLGYEWEFRNRVMVLITTSPLNPSFLLPPSPCIGINWFSAVTKALVTIGLVIVEPSFTIFYRSIKVLLPYYVMAVNEIPPQFISLMLALNNGLRNKWNWDGVAGKVIFKLI